MAQILDGVALVWGLEAVIFERLLRSGFQMASGSLMGASWGVLGAIFEAS